MCIRDSDLGKPDPSLEANTETAFHETWLPAILDDLDEGASLILLFDEFDVLTAPQAEQAAETFFPYLRDLIANERQRLQFVFVIGRNIDDWTNIARALFKGTRMWHVSLLNQKDTTNLIVLSEGNESLFWTDEAIERVWQLTNGHPLLTQQLCSEIWENAYDAEPSQAPVVQIQDVDNAIDSTLRASQPALEWLWDGLPPAERLVSSALAEVGSGTIDQKTLEHLLVESGGRLLIRDLQNAPQTLQHWGILESVEQGYRFRVELLRRWLVIYKPLERIQEELDYVEPIAENLYKAASGLYDAKQFEQAIPPLRQAIRLYPSHLGANELLTQIWLSQGNIDEAQELMEALYESRPGVARPYLITILLRQAQRSQSQDGQLGFYERILSLEPGNIDATSEKQRIWLQRAEEAWKANELEKALEAYQILEIPDKVAEVKEEIYNKSCLQNMLKPEIGMLT
jgi:tetratricopeptide (TPR) repeat protein